MVTTLCNGVCSSAACRVTQPEMGKNKNRVDSSVLCDAINVLRLLLDDDLNLALLRNDVEKRESVSSKGFGAYDI